MKGKKKTGAILLLAVLWILVFPISVQAGGKAAVICVKYGLVNEHGRYDYFDTRSYSLTQTVQGPDASGETKRYYSNNCFHYYIGFEDTIQHPAGVYKLTRIDYPAGYELDTDALNIYPLSVVVTQEQLDEYLAWEGPGCMEYEIIVPIKKAGTFSNLFTKPLTPQIRDYSKEGCLDIDVSGYNLTYQLEYSLKKNSGYKTLYSGDKGYVYFSSCKELKEGQAYYFRAKVYKTVGVKKVYSDYSKTVKVKVYKDPYFMIQSPVIQCVYKNGKPSNIACATYSGQDAVTTATFYYSDKKAGTYKVLATQSAKKAQLKNLKKLKLGKTWYVKMRWTKKYPDGTTINSKYSKIITINRR